MSNSAGNRHSFNDRLVCVFLRILEYFEGLMFLTTNNVRKIDNAIWSRIDYMSQYPPLSLRSRTPAMDFISAGKIDPRGKDMSVFMSSSKR